jgi:hypothetical protein
MSGRVGVAVLKKLTYAWEPPLGIGKIELTALGVHESTGKPAAR